jgi:hypothetical protein
MKTFYMLYSDVNDGRLTKVPSLEDARREGKIQVNKDRGNTGDVFIMKAVERVLQPVPDAEVQTLED